ncbi:UDP-glucuronosyl/UDP-glucosyltransferase [Arabidopsis thaliana x Arabidopsis arenosa]|uniref:Glycosyltransferase n=1 Tax=Arabidopsis thaliana x Arabidopsis arenosa TaxID=1240361 RepID=A0A8T2A8F3_9BRAS|nr:UDP-glucuronosyl/UDP-glucosyltransferase [Arabidopsis thaliana x Arabidopsis arenosa]
MASEETHQFHPSLHFVLFPFMAQGHMIPMIDIARLLAQRGVTITIVTTPQNAARFKNVLSRAIESGLPINLVHVKFPYQEAGLQEGQENIDSLDSKELMVPFIKAVNMLEEPVTKLMEEIKPKPSCLISDWCLPYTSIIAKKFNIPKIVFHGMGCFCLLCMHVLRQNLEILENVKSDKEYLLVPCFPDKVEFTKPQLPVKANASGDWKEIMDEMVKAEYTSYGVVVNTFEELEPAYVKDYKEARAGKVWSIGPVSLCNKVGADKAERGNKAAIDQDECLKWLDSKEEGSVLYVCLGSICNLPLAQLKELGLGLEESQRPFIWVIRGWEKYNELSEWMLESGFEERIKERGLLIRGWAPQVLILSHPSVGGFLTHCGWNSTLEGITSGIPLLTWPLFADQFCNEKLVVQVLKAGVRAGVEQPMQSGEEEKIGVLVGKEGVKKAVEELMGNSDDAKERRRRAKELGELAHKAVEEGGSSHSNITFLLQDIMQLAQFKN